MKLLHFVLGASFFLPSFSLINTAFANEDVEVYLAPEVVVSTSRFVQEIDQVGSSVTVITAEDIREKQATTLAEALRSVPGVSIVEYSENGTASIFMRGGNGNGVLVLLDGIPLNDTSQPSFDFNRISLANVDRIEVVRGAQSAIYGANALSGVVNIITKRGYGEPSGLISASIGLPFTVYGNAQVSAGNETLSWALGASGEYNNQLSTLVNTSEHDSLSAGAFSGSLNYTPNNIFELYALARADIQRSEFDDGFGLDSDAYIDSNIYLFNLAPSLYFFDGMWSQTLNLSYLNSTRDVYSPTSPNYFASQTFRADWQHKLDLDIHHIAFGALYEHDTLLANKHSSVQRAISRNNYALYAEYSVNPIDNLYITLAGRYDNNSDFDDALTGTASLAYTFAQTNTLFHASIGTSYRAPTIEDVHGGAYYAPSLNLQPEEAFSWDIGFSQPLFDDKLTVFATYYDMHYSNMIAYNYNFVTYLSTAYNAGKVRTQGVELGFNFTPSENLTLSYSATFSDTHNYSTGKEQLRQPNTVMALDIDYRLPFEGDMDFFIGASVNYVGAYDDFNYNTYPATPVISGDYFLVDLRFRADITENLSLMAHVNNLFDEEYTVVYGYETLGINGTIGVEYRF